MQERLAVRAVDVHFVDEQERRDLVAPQKLPQRMGMALHAARAADDQNGIIQHLKRPLHLRRKIHMPRRVEQRHRALRQRQHRLLGKDRNAALALQRVRIQKGVAVVNAAEAADGTAAIKHRLGQGGLARIDMGQNPDH